MRKIGYFAGTLLVIVFALLGSRQETARGQETTPGDSYTYHIPLLYTQASFSCREITEIPQSECEALEAFWRATNPNWPTVQSWSGADGWLVTNQPCTWYGISCREGRVSGIKLPNNGLQGDLPAEIGNLANLEQLGLGGNQLHSLPTQIGNLAHLDQLGLGGNQLDSLPAEIGNLINLRRLGLGSNQLSSLPPEIGNLANLQTLLLSHNQLSSLPAEIGNLANLQSLLLANNQLSTLPPEIGNLANLLELGLGDNQLGSLPAEIGSLTKLHQLGLGGNQLNSLPVEIGNLANLEYLRLGSNRLSSLPKEITWLADTWIVIHNNCLVLTDTEIINYLNDRSPGWQETQRTACD